MNWLQEDGVTVGLKILGAIAIFILGRIVAAALPAARATLDAQEARLRSRAPDDPRRWFEEVYALERYIDAQSGGPGEGWLRIVTTPEEARQVIAEGKLAVTMKRIAEGLCA